MFYPLQQVSDHPCFAMQELLYSVFYSAVFEVPFGKKVFPDRFSATKRLWGYLSGMRNDIEELYVLLLQLSLADRKRIYSQLCDNNMIELFCEDPAVEPDDYLSWGSGIGMKIKDIVYQCYERLDLSHFRRPGCKIKPTHRYYRDYIKLNKSVCPFCSINAYKNPLSPRREDFDHYLCKSKYPLAAANMDNLVPMCNECNQDYKKNIDLLHEDAHRIVAFYPFSQLAGVSIKVDSIVDRAPPYYRRWSVDLILSDPLEAAKIKNWDRVFSVMSRLTNEVVQSHDEWIYQALDEKSGEKIVNVQSFRRLMRERSTKEAKKAQRRNEPKALLKSAYFEYVQKRADDIFIESYIQLHNESV